MLHMQIEPGRINESLEVLIPREQRNATVNTGLRADGE